ncbi:MAG: HAD family hydrolase [Oscillospiraceae bacterium]|nr:HAD family hydrolase [Oscillospiraceae bacterium]
MIKAVLFDIDNTLYGYDAAHAMAWEALCAYVQEHLHMDRETFTRRHREAMDIVKERLGVDCAALHDRCLRYQILLEKHGLPLHHALTMSELYWDTLIRSAEPTPGIMECLPILKKAGYILGIGTDMTLEYQLKKLTRLQMLPYFDFLVTSEEVNGEKPDRKLFLTCAQKAGVAPEECLFIGDSLKKDVLGAKNAGMEALWFAPPPEQAAMHPETETIYHYDHLTKKLKCLDFSRKTC